MLGSARTEIELAYSVTDDYVPQSGILTWATGDSSDKIIQVQITEDEQVDSEMNETFTVELSNAVGIFLDAQKTVTTVSIKDMDGPGKITVTPTAGIVGERETCCFRCDATVWSASQRRWCATFQVERIGGGRGAICADYSVINGSALIEKHVISVAAAARTFCWSNREIGAKTATVQMPFHGTYDQLFRDFTVRVALSTALSSVRVDGAGIGSDGVIFGEDAVQIIEDMDADVGQITFIADGTTGFSVFKFDREDGTAVMQVCF